MPVIELPRAVNTDCRYVRVRQVRPDGYVEFDFSIGDPEMAVELILPQAAYEEFCATHRVCHLTPAQAAAVDSDQAKWRYGAPGLFD